MMLRGPSPNVADDGGANEGNRSRWVRYNERRPAFGLARVSEPSGECLSFVPCTSMPCSSGPPSMATNPILALFVVRDLGLSAWEYGLVLGVPCLGGMLAGMLSYRLVRRWGRDRVLPSTGLVRVVWLLPLTAVPVGPATLAVILTLQFGLLFTTKLFNPTFASTRMTVTPADRISSVVGSWAATTRLVHPITTGRSASWPRSWVPAPHSQSVPDWGR